MLSAAPTVDVSAAIVGQPLATASIAGATIQIQHANSTTLLPRFETSISVLQGVVTNSAGVPVTLDYELGDTADDASLTLSPGTVPAGSGVLQISQPPGLDPLGPRLSSMEPPGPVIGPQPPAGPEPVSVSNPGNAPVSVAPGLASPAPPTVAAGPTGRSASDNGPRWLSASFSPAEAHRLDTVSQPLDTVSQPADQQTAVPSRDAQTRSSLQPTRLTSQTFCVVTEVPSVARGDDDPHVLDAGGPLIGTQATPTAPRSIDRASAEPSQEATPGAAHDAAMAGWIAGPRLAEALVRSLTAGRESSSAREELLLEGDAESVDEAADSWVRSERWFGDERHWVGAALAVIALKSLHSLDRGQPAETARPRLLRKSQSTGTSR